jgi:hypothetical protein
MEAEDKITIRGNLPYWARMTTDRDVTVTRMMTCRSEFNKCECYDWHVFSMRLHVVKIVVVRLQMFSFSTGVGRRQEEAPGSISQILNRSLALLAIDCLFSSVGG